MIKAGTSDDAAKVLEATELIPAWTGSQVEYEDSGALCRSVSSPSSMCGMRASNAPTPTETGLSTDDRRPSHQNAMHERFVTKSSQTDGVI